LYHQIKNSPKNRGLDQVLKLKNEKIIEKLEKILYQEKKKNMRNEFSQMTLEEFNAIIDRAENDALHNRVFNAGEILKDIDTWK